MASRDRTVAVAALYLGPDNAEACVGYSWRWVRDTARELGVPLVQVGRRYLIPVEAFRAALEREQVPVTEAANDVTRLASPEAVRRALGLARAGGAV